MNQHRATGRMITVESQRKDLNTIFLKLRIADSTGIYGGIWFNYHHVDSLLLVLYTFVSLQCAGHAQNIHFPFDIEADTSISVATEMVVQLDLTDQDVTAIADMIDAEIRSHIPDWSFDESIDNQGDEVADSETGSSEADDEISELRNESDATNNGFTQEQLPSGRKYWSDSPRRDNEISHLVEEPHIGDNMPNGTSKMNDDIVGDVKPEEHQSLGASVEDICGRISSSVSLSNPSVIDRSTSGASVSTSSCSSDNGHPIADPDERLASLLSQQQEELSVLRRKHKADIEEILNGVPAQDREETLTRCRLKADQKNISDRI
jgi:WNK lysine deficient protein kinase